MIITPKNKVNRFMIITIFEFFKPEYLKVLIWLFVLKSWKKSCVAIKKIKGNISKINDGVFNNDKYIGKYVETFISLKNSSSVSKFKINIRLKAIKNIFKKEVK